MVGCENFISPPVTLYPPRISPPPASRSSFLFSGDAVHSLFRLRRASRSMSIIAPKFRKEQIVAAERAEPLKIMISGAPASGKATQCELISHKVPEDILIERVAGRRLNTVTGKIYHLKYSPPETEEIAARLTLRFDDTEEKAKLRLKTHNQNVRDGFLCKIKGNRSKEDMFTQIDTALSELLQQRNTATSSFLS